MGLRKSPPGAGLYQLRPPQASTPCRQWNVPRVTLTTRLGYRCGMPTSRRILVLDDSQLHLQLEREVLERRGHVVRTARDILEFERELQAFQPEIVLTDLIMPEVMGTSVVQTLKDNLHTDKIPVILVSSRPESELAILAEAIGADGHLSKEGGLEKLGERVDQLVSEILW
ncbi:MAG: response regulator [Myxococcales bacterium]